MRRGIFSLKSVRPDIGETGLQTKPVLNSFKWGKNSRNGLEVKSDLNVKSFKVLKKYKKTKKD